MTVETRARTAAMDRLYDELPTINCKKKCAEACGPIFMSQLEWQRITDRLGYVPRRDLERQLKRAKKTGNIRELDCPMLAKGLCSVHPIRPMICRLWGVVETMRCPFGCVPSPRYLTHEEGQVFLRRANAIGSSTILEV